MPMAYVLSLDGAAVDQKTGQTANGITYRQFARKDDPEEIAQTLNRFAAGPELRDALPPWSANEVRVG